MARFRGARYLSCFYCGKRSGLKYDGVTRDFLCLYCDATNYLDEVIARLQSPPTARQGIPSADENRMERLRILPSQRIAK